MVSSDVSKRAMIEFQDGFLKRLRESESLSKNNKLYRWVNFQLRKDTYNDLIVASQNLLRDFIARAQREKPLSNSEDLIPVGLLLGAMEFRYSDILKIPNIKTTKFQNKA